MPDDDHGFTASEFTLACRRLAQPVSQWRFNDRDSCRFLERCCEVGLLVRDGDRYVATHRLHMALSPLNTRR
jgi:hypothetical protein